jgi:GTPase SAR1 family protein
MIIAIRGTHGSGKTTLVRTILREHYPDVQILPASGRRRVPFGYRCHRESGRSLFIPGSYEHPVTGGCDNIRGADIIYALIRKHAERGYDVLYEGLVAQHSTPYIMSLHEDGYRVRIIVLDLPWSVIVRGVHARRKLRGQTPAFNSRVEVEGRNVMTGAERLRAAGVSVHYATTRSKALHRVITLLKLDSHAARTPAG